MLVSVLYVDYGNEEVLPLSELRQLDHSLYRLPCQAMYCSMPSIRPCLSSSSRSPDTKGAVLQPHTWPAAVSVWFGSVMIGKPLYVCIISSGGKNNFEVDAYVPSDVLHSQGSIKDLPRSPQCALLNKKTVSPPVALSVATFMVSVGLGISSSGASSCGVQTEPLEPVNDGRSQSKHDRNCLSGPNPSGVNTRMCNHSAAAGSCHACTHSSEQGHPPRPTAVQVHTSSLSPCENERPCFTDVKKPSHTAGNSSNISNSTMCSSTPLDPLTVGEVWRQINVPMSTAGTAVGHAGPAAARVEPSLAAADTAKCSKIAAASCNTGWSKPLSSPQCRAHNDSCTEMMPPSTTVHELQHCTSLPECNPPASAEQVLPDNVVELLRSQLKLFPGYKANTCGSTRQGERQAQPGVGCVQGVSAPYNKQRHPHTFTARARESTTFEDQVPELSPCSPGSPDKFIGTEEFPVSIDAAKPRRLVLESLCKSDSCTREPLISESEPHPIIQAPKALSNSAISCHHRVEGSIALKDVKNPVSKAKQMSALPDLESKHSTTLGSKLDPQPHVLTLADIIKVEPNISEDELEIQTKWSIISEIESLAMSETEGELQSESLTGSEVKQFDSKSKHDLREIQISTFQPADKKDLQTVDVERRTDTDVERTGDLGITDVKETGNPEITDVEGTGSPEITDVEDEVTDVKETGNPKITNVEGEITDVEGTGSPEITDVEGEVTDVKETGNPEITDGEGEITDMKETGNPEITDGEGEITDMKETGNPEITDVEGEVTDVKETGSPEITGGEGEITDIKETGNPEITDVEGEITDMKETGNPEITNVEREITDVEGTGSSEITDVQGEVTDVVGTGNLEITDVVETGNPEITDVKGEITYVEGTGSPEITDVKGEITDVEITGSPEITDVEGTGNPEITDVKDEITDVKGEITSAERKGSPEITDVKDEITDVERTGNLEIIDVERTGNPEITDVQGEITDAEGTGSPEITGVKGDAEGTGSPEITRVERTGNPEITDAEGTGSPEITGVKGDAEGTGSPEITRVERTGNPEITDVKGEITGAETTGSPEITDVEGEITDLEGTGNPKITDVEGTGYPVITDVKGEITDAEGTGSPEITGLKGEITDAEGTGSPEITGVERTGNPEITDVKGEITRTGSPEITDMEGTGYPEITDVKGEITDAEETGNGNPEITDVEGEITDVKGEITDAEETGSPEITGVEGNVNPEITDVEGEITDVEGEITDVERTGSPEITDVEDEITDLEGTGNPEITDTAGTGYPDITDVERTGSPKITDVEKEITDLEGTVNPDITDMAGTGYPEITDVEGAGYPEITDLKGEITDVEGTGSLEITDLKGEITDVEGTGSLEITDVESEITGVEETDNPASLPCILAHEQEVCEQVSCSSTPAAGPLSWGSLSHSKPILLSARGEFALLVSHVNSPSQFYVHPVQTDTAHDIDQLTSSMSKHYSVGDNLVPLHPGQFDAGHLCCVQSADDGLWYRGVIVEEMCTSDQCSVLFVDYGDIQVVHKSTLSVLDQMFVKTPIQCVCCSLCGIRPLRCGSADGTSVPGRELCRLLLTLHAYT